MHIVILYMQLSLTCLKLQRYGQLHHSDPAEMIETPPEFKYQNE